MNVRMWKRLQVVGTLLSYQHRQIVCICRDGRETDEEFQAKINQWKSGEVVDGIDGKYEGGEVNFVGVVGASA